MTNKKAKPLAFRIELIRLILKYFTRTGGIDGPYHLRGYFLSHMLPQETYTVFRAINAKGQVKEATIYKGKQQGANPLAKLSLKEVKILIAKIITHYGSKAGKDIGTSEGIK